MSTDFPPKQWDIWFATLREGMPWVVKVEPQDSGLLHVSYIECDQLQALSPSQARFQTFRKKLSGPKRAEVALALQNVLRGALPERG